MIGNRGFSQKRKSGRELSGNEYEIKFEFHHKNLELRDYLTEIENALYGNEQYIIDPVQTVSTMNTHFFMDIENNTEYSVFNYDGQLMLKIKKHQLLEYGRMPVYANVETFQYEKNRIRHILEQPHVRYVGTMTKNRIKDFLMNNHDGRIYSLAVTICEANDRFQYQFEIEYNGYSSQRESILEDEDLLIGKLVQVGEDIYSSANAFMKPSRERKYEFVTKSGCPANPQVEKTAILNALS
ncbi:hypothetical protein ACFSL6_22605 [Paenibacillus thailandensis]|uniref:CYTH domain-containing protein n=1 Tax=Paenibacillus thailandensis TaxID=393250 RepID=A0ABW5R1J6_9BACL